VISFSPDLTEQKEMAGTIPGARSVVVSDAGHALFVDNPDKFDEELTRLLQSFRIRRCGLLMTVIREEMSDITGKLGTVKWGIHNAGWLRDRYQRFRIPATPSTIKNYFNFIKVSNRLNSLFWGNGISNNECDETGILGSFVNLRRRRTP
jgi:hypothetical protein